ncbi:CLAVATA3/ESR (CLE)-related protein 25-like isoform X2 [Actinidia eriantha]|uniref:CLAVATA3/ESR (CLE)-related protein 25-like isoform X2 n=1 Tax=Actinidia eriantha TaxID=165200 RepID=UPI0025854887|nr:CLAVATA3/ESR (CLE)-related protein 25-like isoform X2 [Actinidia eriantha]
MPHNSHIACVQFKNMGCSGRVLKAMFVGFIWLVLVGVLETGGTKTTTTLNPLPSGGLKHEEMRGIEKLAVHLDQSDLNYMSKRRVPNGPDPIHNRRTGNSRNPPDQA